MATTHFHHQPQPVNIGCELSDALSYVDSFGDGVPDFDDYGSLVRSNGGKPVSILARW